MIYFINDENNEIQNEVAIYAKKQFIGKEIVVWKSGNENFDQS